jgi:hypothetical protein
MLFFQYDQISAVIDVRINDIRTFHHVFSNFRKTIGMVRKKIMIFAVCPFLLHPSFVSYSLAGYWRCCMERTTMDGYDSYRQHECK